MSQRKQMLLALITREMQRVIYGLKDYRKTTVAALVILVAGVWFWNCLPATLFNIPLSPVLFSKEGELLAARVASDEQWRFPPMGNVPEKFAKALIQYEDKRFYRHPGVDPLAISRAIVLNFQNKRVVSGASTLSMQVIRLSRGNPPRTLSEKLYEMILALRLELRYSKAEILSLYASYAPFGGNIVGLEAASWRYFGRRPEQISWAEAAMLAVLPNSPGLVHMTKNRNTLLGKRDALLADLHQDGYIDDLQLKLAQAEALPRGLVRMPARAFHLLHTLAAQSRITRRFDTTLSSEYQRIVDDVVAHQRGILESQGIDNLAVLMVDNETFEVKAYVGNSLWSAAGDRGHAVDIVRRARSTGSILKPFLFASMLQTGEITPVSLIPDLPTRYDGYAPENYDRQFRGAVPAKEALARSLNIPAVRMLRQFGVDRFFEFLRRAGVSTLGRTSREYGLTLILGGAEATLWDITNLYANLADISQRGSFEPGQTYKKLRVLHEDTTETDQVRDIQPGAAWLTLNALVDVNRPDDDAHWRVFSSSRKIAWKTGTSFGHRDGWAVGSTPKYTIAVWTGNATGEGRPDLTGTGTAAPILFEIFNRIGSSGWFREPEGDLIEVDVCAADGYLPTEECPTLKTKIPVDAHFEKLSPFQRLVHLSEDGRYQVHSACESPEKMQHRNWFVLPPAMEYHYRGRNLGYEQLPGYRKDCQGHVLSMADQNPIGVVYPKNGAKVFLPVDLSRKPGELILEMVHREGRATLYWHLDKTFIGETRDFHQQAISIAPGRHTLTVVDDLGNEQSVKFTVMGLEKEARAQ